LKNNDTHEAEKREREIEKKVINLNDVIDNRASQEFAADLMDTINLIRSLGPEAERTILAFFIRWVEAEVRCGLGIEKYGEPGDEFEKTPWFDMIDKNYQEAAGGCYFCDKTIDARAVEVNANTKLCWMCQAKMANWITALGLDPGKVLASATGPTKVQKTRINAKSKQEAS
jgi:hypothetical protein